MSSNYIIEGGAKVTNTQLLRKKIKNSGLKISYIADVLEISRYQLYRKIENIRPFNQYEIEKICHLLNIKSVQEKESIFFAKYVD